MSAKSEARARRVANWWRKEAAAFAKQAKRGPGPLSEWLWASAACALLRWVLA